MYLIKNLKKNLKKKLKKKLIKKTFKNFNIINKIKYFLRILLS